MRGPMSSSSAVPRVSVAIAVAAVLLQLSCGGGGSEKCPVTTPNCSPGGNTPTVVSVTLSGAPTGNMTINQTATVTATVAVTNGASQAVNWSSSNTIAVGL